MKALRIVVGFLLVVVVPSIGQAGPFVLPGWDLLQSQPGTIFAGVPFNGVPLGSFDFGAPIGVKNTGLTDTIVHRLNTANAPSQAISTELLALQLVSAVPTDFGLGVDFYYVTLQSARGGPASTGGMTINFGPEANPHGTADSFFDVFFDVRKGALNGPIALANNLLFVSNGVPWSHTPPASALEIFGVNSFLAGRSRDADFWPLGEFRECAPTGACEVLRTTTVVPEPVSLLLVGFGTAGAVLRARSRRPR